MMRNRKHAVAALAAIATALPMLAQSATIDVKTDAFAAEIFAPTTLSFTPWPWADFGLGGLLNIGQLPVTVTVGGQTQFNLAQPGPGQTFLPGSTTVSLGYTPAWTGSVEAGSKGYAEANLALNLGPFDLKFPIGSSTASASLTADIGPALQSSGAGTKSSVGLGPTIGAGPSLSADIGICPLCYTAASISTSVNVGAKQQQTATWDPNTTYGDLVWVSKQKALTVNDVPVFVTGHNGAIDNVFGNPAAAMSLSDGDVIYYNILPNIKLDMTVKDEAILSVPVSLSFEADIFGNKTSKNFSANLVDFSTGVQTLHFDSEWFGKTAFSVELDVTKLCNSPSNCAYGFKTPGTAPALPYVNNGLFDDNLPSDTRGDSSLVTLTGPGTILDRPLFTNGLCSPTAPTQCIEYVAFSSTAVPEPASLALVSAGLLGLGGLSRKQRSAASGVVRPV